MNISKVECGGMVWDIPIELEMPAEVAGDQDKMDSWIAVNRDVVFDTIIRSIRDGNSFEIVFVLPE